ncbi:hypothetical protein CVIRNUC_006075 [Coccomyxa viridis]|uniref:Uncharacterized protein n=1 Tax=Coccomyxa viridis TaxID=1274662 RepID=A0AAV1I9A4_9CHLO|nr:hypothetical protein CVIRNUC_006075 [Coccomyxa viridis]
MVLGPPQTGGQPSPSLGLGPEAGLMLAKKLTFAVHTNKRFFPTLFTRNLESYLPANSTSALSVVPGIERSFTFSARPLAESVTVVPGE